ncbi:MAG TPA: tetratricopeptide repeat protein [Polyangiaceae bacterium]|nr:tetratricopeptide repeat protein [Polyangiaceae bacterium]
MRPCLAVAAVLPVLIASVTLPAWADGVLPAVATPVQREQAQARFARGKELLGKKQYDAALTEFRASHEIVASPNTRLELARCLRAMGRLVAAYAELGRASVEAKELVGQDNRYQRAFDSATAERAEIEPQLGFVVLTITSPSDDTKVTVGGEEIRRAAWAEPAPAVAGETEVVVETPGHAPVRRKLTLAAGQKTALTVDAQSGDLPGGAAPPPPAPPAPVEAGPSPLRTAAYVAGGVGVAGLVTFGIAGILARSTYNDLNGACHGGPCPPDKTGEISSGKTQQTIANVGLIVGIAGVAGGGTLFVLSLGKSSSGPTTGLAVGPGWAGVRGRF